MSSQFEVYREQFTTVLKQVGKLLAAAEDASDLLQEAEEIIPQMSLEARSVEDALLKQELMDITKAYKMQLRSYKEQNEKREILAGRKTSADHHRDRLVQQQDSLEKQNQQLESARKTMEETEHVALEISQGLSQNRKTLENTQGSLHQLSSMSDQAKGLLTKLSRKWF
jgi:chromosome segregation ATPase